MTHNDNGGGPEWNYGETSLFAVFCVLLSKNGKNSKIVRFSIISVGTASNVIVGHFLANPTKFDITQDSLVARFLNFVW